MQWAWRIKGSRSYRTCLDNLAPRNFIRSPYSTDYKYPKGTRPASYVENFWIAIGLFSSIFGSKHHSSRQLPWRHIRVLGSHNQTPMQCLSKAVSEPCSRLYHVSWRYLPLFSMSSKASSTFSLLSHGPPYFSITSMKARLTCCGIFPELPHTMISASSNSS